MIEPQRILFTFWGRRGALSQFALEAARAARERSDIAATFSISRHNESFRHFSELAIPLLPIETFSSHAGAAIGLWRIPGLRRRLADYARSQGIQVVLELMPHIWSPLLVPAACQAGAHYATIVHDASAHPGDRTALVKPLLDISLRKADRVLTLSNAVTQNLISAGRVPAHRITTLFHPDLKYTGGLERRPPDSSQAFRLLFLGRIMPYKGLPLFVDAVELLRARGIAVQPCIYGEGSLGGEEARLRSLGAEVVNRWLTATEIKDALAAAHVVVLSHVEASQSGVAAAAFGARLPVVATPVGGLVEQVEDNRTGVLARAVTGAALAEAIARLVTEPGLYSAILARLQADRQSHSMDHFLDVAMSAVLQGGRLAPPEGASRR